MKQLQLVFHCRPTNLTDKIRGSLGNVLAELRGIAVAFFNKNQTRYVEYTADVPVGFTTATYADTVVLAAHSDRIEAFLRLQESLSYIQKWLKKMENQN